MPNPSIRYCLGASLALLASISVSATTVTNTTCVSDTVAVSGPISCAAISQDNKTSASAGVGGANITNFGTFLGAGVTINTVVVNSLTIHHPGSASASLDMFGVFTTPGPVTTGSAILSLNGISLPPGGNVYDLTIGSRTFQITNPNTSLTVPFTSGVPFLVQLTATVSAQNDSLAGLDNEVLAFGDTFRFFNANGTQLPVLASTVPEPASWVLMMICTFTAGFLMLRGRRRASLDA
jgi:hypothetical protein